MIKILLVKIILINQWGHTRESTMMVRLVISHVFAESEYIGIKGVGF